MNKVSSVGVALRVRYVFMGTGAGGRVLVNHIMHVQGVMGNSFHTMQCSNLLLASYTGWDC